MTMWFFLFAFLLPAVAASPAAVGEVSERFDLCLAEMVKRLMDSGQETVMVGDFPVGRFTIKEASLGNLTTLRRTSDASLILVGGRVYLQGGVALGEMVIGGKTALGEGASVVEPRLFVGDNLWNYNFRLKEDPEDCADEITVLPLDLGRMRMTSGDGRLSAEEDEETTRVVKMSMTDHARKRLNSAIARVFRDHFDFCNLGRN